MINYKIFVLFICISDFFYSQKIVADLNSDKVNDTLNYKCYRAFEYKDYIEPTCELVLKLGLTSKLYRFNLDYMNYPVISTCGSGCISIYDSSKDTEYTREYQYIKKYDDWVLTRDEDLLRYENDKKINNIPKDYLLGISERKYPILKRKIKKKSQRKNSLS